MQKKHIRLDTIRSIRKDIINSGILTKSHISGIEKDDVVFSRLFLEYIGTYHPEFEIKANNYKELFSQLESYYEKIEDDVIYNNETSSYYEPRLLVVKDSDFVYDMENVPKFDLLNVLNHTTKQEFKAILSLLEDYGVLSPFWEISEIAYGLSQEGHGKETVKKVSTYLKYYFSNKPQARDLKNKNVNTIYRILSKKTQISRYTELFFPKDFTQQEFIFNFSDLINVSFFGGDDGFYYNSYVEYGIYSHILLGFNESGVFIHDCTFENIEIATKHIKKTWNYLCYLSQNLNT